MNRTVSMAIIAFIASYFLASPSYSQTIILINGIPTQVVLEGEKIKSILNDKIYDHLAYYGQNPDDAFTNSLIEMSPEASNAKVALRSKNMMASSHVNRTSSEVIKIKLE